MQKAPIISQEAQRLVELHSLSLLDTPDEEALDSIVKLAAHITGCPVSLISLVDSDRQWFKAKIGTEQTQTPRDISFCGHAIADAKLFMVENALEDSRFSDNPLVVEDPNIRFYAGQPLVTKNGFIIGTLCTLDQVPRQLTDEQKLMLEALGKQAMLIIENRLNEVKLKNVQSNVELAFEHSQVIVAFMKGPTHRFSYVNPAHVKLLSGVNATGKTVLEVQPEAKDTGLLELLDQVYREGKTLNLSGTPFLVGQNMRYFDFTFTPSLDHKKVIDGVICIANDVTHQKTLELQLIDLNTESETQVKKISTMLEQVPIPMAFLEGADHRFQFANKLYRDYFLSGQDYLGRTVDELLPDARKQGFVDLLDTVFSSGKSYAGKEIPYEIKPPSNDPKNLYLNFVYDSVRDEDSNVTGILAAISDVTEQVQAREEIAKIVEDLKEERDLRERFVAALTHDLRTPLTAAKMSAQLLDRKIEESSKKLTRRIIGSMDRADEMIRDLLDASKIKAGEKVSLSIEECHLSELTHATIEDLTTVHGERFRASIDPNVAGFWDCGILRRVLENLANNAIKYGSSVDLVTVKLSQLNDQIKLSVHNLGNPIPENEQLSLFEPYKRSESAAQQKGWGIGLTLVKGFTEALGGEVSLKSSLREGTTFTVNLPMDSRI